LENSNGTPVRETAVSTNPDLSFNNVPSQIPVIDKGNMILMRVLIGYKVGRFIPGYFQGVLVEQRFQHLHVIQYFLKFKIPFPVETF